MPSTYTLNNGIELIGTGEQSGTWGDTTNTNLSLLDTSLDGQVTVTLTAAGTSGSPNTLPISDGAASDGRNRMVIFNDGGDLGATAYVQLTPNDAEKIIYIRNSLSGDRDLIVFQGTYNASNDYVVPNGKTAIVYFDGAGSGAVAANVFNNAHFDALNVVGSVTVDDGTFRVDASLDRVGVNTATPVRPLHVSGGTLDNVVLIESEDAAAYMSFIDNSTTNNTTVFLGSVADEFRLSAESYTIRKTTGNSELLSIDTSGDMAVDTDTLYVDAVNNRVFVNATSASATANRELNVLGAGNVYLRIETDGSDFPAIELANVAAGKETWTIRNDDITNDFIVTGDDGNGIRLTNDNKFGIGNIASNDPSHPLYVDYTSTETTAIVPMARLIARSSGTTGAGFGNKIDFLAQRDTGNALQVQGSLEYVASINSGTDLSSDLVISTAKAGVSTEALRVDYNGAVIIGTGDSITSEYSLYINNSAPVLAFTDSNSFADANDRWEIRGSANGGFGTLETQFWDDSASAMTVYARYRPDEIQFNPDAADIDFFIKGDSVGNLFHVDASEDRIGIGTSTPDYRLHVMSNSNNSDIARFTGAQASNGLLISTYSSGGSNDGGVDFTATHSFGFRGNGSDILNLFDTSVSVPDGLQARYSSTQGFSISGGGSKAAFRIGRLTGLGSRARIELTGSNGYGDGAFGQCICEAGQGNAGDEMMLNIYNIGRNAVNIRNLGTGSYDFYTDRIDSTTFDIWVLLGTYYRVNFQVTEQSGFTPYFDNLNTSGGTSLPGTATQANNQNILNLQAGTVSVYDKDSGVRKAAFNSGHNLVVGNNGTALNDHRLQVISPDSEPTATFYRARNTAGGSLANFLSDVGGSQTNVARIYTDGSALFTNGVYIGSATTDNHLDTYEEGSFSVSISDGTLTETWDTAYYIKVGRIITISGRLTNVPNKASFNGSLAVRIGNIPYPCIANFNGQPLSWRDPVDSTMYHVRSFELNTTQMFLKNDANTSIIFDDLQSTSDLFFSMTYVTTS